MKSYFGKILLSFLMAAFLLNLCGCETLKKKFIRKSNPKKVTPVMVPQDYKGIYSNEVLYNNHFTYWRTWTEDLIQSLSERSSNKRQVLDAERAIEDLLRMQQYLKSPMKEALDPHIKTYKYILTKVRLGQPNEIDAASMMHDLESQRRVIMRKFDTKEARPYILKEEESVKPIKVIEQTMPKKEEQPK